VVAFAIALLGGELVSVWGTIELPAALALGAVWIAAALCRARPTVVTVSGALAAAAIGASLAARAALPPSGCWMPPADEPTKLWIEARIEEAPTRLPDGAIRLRASARTSPDDATPICGSVLLTLQQPPFVPHAGEPVRLHATLRRPRNFANPRAYDQVGALARRGVWVTGHSSGRDLARLGGANRASRLELERERIGRLIDASLAPENASLLRALVIGDEGSVGAEAWDAIAAAGLAHVLSVSGLHIALVWGLAFAIVRWLLARSVWLLLHAHVRALAALAALVPAAGYAALAGLSIPAARSVMMTALLVASLGVGREVRPLRVLCLAATAIALARPGAPLDVSFQLSFVSVLALIVATDACARRWPAEPEATVAARLRRAALLAAVVPAAALLGTAPLVALHFNRWTPIGVMTNPILVPLAGTPATILGLGGAAMSAISEPVAGLVLGMARWPLDLFRFGVAIAAAVPHGNVRVPTPTLVEVALAYLFFALPWVPARARSAVTALLLSLAALDAAAWVRERSRADELRVRFLDVGQGDAAVIELPGGRVMVIDGGGFGRSAFDVGERVVAPYLWSRKIARVDVLVATHGDWDHQGGLHFLAAELAPRELWTVKLPAERKRLEPLERAAVAAGAMIRPLAAGDSLVLGEVRIDCLNPPGNGDLSANDSSLVLRLRFRGVSFLFTGDVESAGESAIARPGAPQAVSVLKVPHHGSDTSSGEPLLRWARPDVAVFSLGAANVYGFPSPAVVARYRRIGAWPIRTDVEGSVWIEGTGHEILVRPFATSSPAPCSIFGVLC